MVTSPPRPGKGKGEGDSAVHCSVDWRVRMRRPPPEKYPRRPPSERCAEDPPSQRWPGERSVFRSPRAAGSDPPPDLQPAAAAESAGPWHLDHGPGAVRGRRGPGGGQPSPQPARPSRDAGAVGGRPGAAGGQPAERGRAVGRARGRCGRGRLVRRLRLPRGQVPQGPRGRRRAAGLPAGLRRVLLRRLRAPRAAPGPHRRAGAAAPGRSAAGPHRADRRGHRPRPRPAGG